MFLVIRKGEVVRSRSLEEAVEAAGPEGFIVTCLRGQPVVLQVYAGTGQPVVEVSGVEGRATAGEGAAGEPPASTGVAAVFDQMFRGFADVVGRYVEGVELHEVVGRGLREPKRRGRIVMWPAEDDFDVLQIVRRLADEGKQVVFFTGDKRLARQAESLEHPRIVVEYMPPNEYPGKESLAQAMIEALRRAFSQSQG